MISVLILTKNEEVSLPLCLRSVSWCDDVVIFDSGSTDRTLEIAQAAGHRVVHRDWDNENAQRTAALKIGFKHPWVFNPDADEFATPELSEEMGRIAADPKRPEAAFRVRRRNYLEGRWLKRSGFSDWWVVRFFRPEKIQFEREINLRYVVDGPEGRLRSWLDHHSFNKGIEDWRRKHERYAELEAREALTSIAQGGLKLGDLFASDINRRRRFMKELSFRMPFRPTLRFLYMYLFRLGFLDGGPGYRYCKLMAWYEGLISRNMRRLKKRDPVA